MTRWPGIESAIDTEAVGPILASIAQSAQAALLRRAVGCGLLDTAGVLRDDVKSADLGHRCKLEPDMSRHTLHHWKELPADSPMPLIRRQRVVGDKVMVSRVVLDKGFHLPVHQHDNEQITCVLSGLVRFTFADGSTADLGPEEVLELPGNVPHGALALEESVLLDIFSPVSLQTGIDRVHETVVQA